MADPFESDSTPEEANAKKSVLAEPSANTTTEVSKTQLDESQEDASMSVNKKQSAPPTVGESPPKKKGTTLHGLPLLVNGQKGPGGTTLLDLGGNGDCGWHEKVQEGSQRADEQT